MPFKRNCKEFTKIKDNSLESTRNFLVAQDTIDQFGNIIDLKRFREASQWLTEQAGKKGHFPDLLVSDEQNGKKAIFNIPAFKKLDGINAQTQKIISRTFKQAEIPIIEEELKAPNGNKSLLPKNLYNIVRTKEFKEWFGDWENDPENSSKILDKNGEPLVVYHGSGKKFEEFDIKRLGEKTGQTLIKGFYFTNIQAHAADYTVDRNNRKYQERMLGYVEAYNYSIEIGKPILEFDANDFEDIRNRYFNNYEGPSALNAIPIDSPELAKEADKFFKDNPQVIELSNKMEDGQIYSDEINGLPKDPDYNPSTYPSFLNIRNPLEINKGGKLKNFSDANKMAKRELKNEDGIVIYNVDDRVSHGSDISGNNNYVVLNPNQIKSTSNIGTFDTNNNNILFTEGRDYESVKSNSKQKLEYFFGDDPQIRIDEVLKRMANTTTYKGSLSIKFLEHLHNNVEVSLLTPEEFQNYKKMFPLSFYEGMNDKSVGGFYNPNRNEIIIINKAHRDVESVLLEEIIHALTYYYIKNDEVFGKQWKEFFHTTKAKFPEQADMYYFKNEYEFLAGVFLDEKMQLLLSTKKSEHKWYQNLWEEVKVKLLNFLTEHLSLNFGERTLLDDAFELGAKVIEESAKDSDERGLRSDETEFMLSALTEEESWRMRDDISKITYELKQLEDKSPIMKSHEQFLTMLSSRLYKLKNNKNYAEVLNIMTDERGVNKFQSLEDIMKKADDAVDSIENIQKKTRQIGLGLVQFNYFLDLSIGRIKELIKDKEHALDNIHTLQYFMYTIRDIEAFLEGATGDETFEGGAREMFKTQTNTTKVIDNALGKIREIEGYILENDETGLVQALKPLLKHGSKELSDYLDREIAGTKERLEKAKRNGDNSGVNTLTELLKDHENSKKRVDFTNDKVLLDFMKGKMGDTNRFSAWLESYRDSPDPITSSFAVWLKRNLDDVNASVLPIDMEYQKELAPWYTQLGTRFNPADIANKITFEDERIDWDGLSYKVLALLQPFKNWRADEQVFKNRIQTIQDEINEGKDVENNEKALQDVKDEYAVWRTTYKYNPYKPEVYKVFDLWKDEIGRELRRESDRIWDRIDEIYEPHTTIGTDLSEDDLSEIKSLMREYKMLGSKYNLDGTEKPEGSRVLAMADRMKEIRTLNNKYYEFKPNQQAFDADKLRHSEYLINEENIAENSDGYKDRMKQWEEENTKEIIDQQYYIDREKDIKLLNYFLSKLPSTEAKNLQVGVLWKEILDIVYGNRDEDNQPIGSEIGESQTDKMRTLQLKIEDVKARFAGLSGLTEAENARKWELIDLLRAGEISQEERLELNDLNTQSRDFGLDKDTSDTVKEIFQRLTLMSSKTPTEYYVESWNAVASKYGGGLNDKGEVIEGGKRVDVLTSDFLNILLKQADFKAWFDINHIIVKKFDAELGRKVDRWERLYKWSKLIPSNPAYIKTVPASKYSYRVIRDEFKEDRIVGKTIDNKGVWMPKMSSEIDPSVIDRDKYVNKRYFELANSKRPEDVALFNILNIHAKYLLKGQEDIPFSNRLGLDVPRFLKESSERNLDMVDRPKELPGVLWNRFTSKLRSVEDYQSETGNFESVYADKYGNEFNSVPIRGTGQYEVEAVSKDLPRSIMKYYHSAQTNKKLIEISPVTNALQRVLDAPINKPKDITKKIRGRSYSMSPILGTNNRKQNIDFMIKRELTGQEKAYELTKLGDGIASFIKNLGAWSYLKLNFPSSVANVVNAVNQNFITAGQGYYSASDYGWAVGEYWTKVVPSLQADYWENKIGEKSLYGQMLDRFEPVQGMNVFDEIGHKISSSKIKDLFGFNWLFNHRTWGEFFVQSRVWLAYMRATKIEHNGKTISLYDAYELDSKGIIRLKEGIDPDWDFKGEKFYALKERIQHTIRVTHGNYAKYDKTYIDQYTLFSFASFLKRFFVAMATNRLAGANVKVSKAGITSEPRFNIGNGKQWGFYMASLNAASKQLQNRGLSWQILSNEEKAALMRSAQEFGIIIGASLIIRGLFGFNPDDKDRYKKLKNKNWLELHLLYQIMRLQVETQTFVSPTQYGQFIFKFMAWEALLKWIKIGEDALAIFTNPRQAKYQKKTGNIKRGTYKVTVDIKRALGVAQIEKTMTPDELVASYQKTIRGR